MTTKRTSLQFLLATALLLVVAGSLSGYVLLSPRRTWDSAPDYAVDDRGLVGVTDSTGGVASVVSAITGNGSWNGAGKGTLIRAHSGSVGGFRLGDNVPMLNFTDPQNACKGTCLAATFTGYYSQRSDGTYRIDDADIVTNTAQPWVSTAEPDGCSAEYYIEGVMVHETGHAIGLAHSNVSGATMYPSVSACNNGPASIENDDKAAIADLFGGGGGGGCTLLPAGGACSSNAQCCSNSCKGKPGSKTCK
jgi:hypothetical protein